MSLLDPQPPPVRTRGDVWADVLATTWAPRALRAEMRARRRQGIDRYGTPLQVGNLRDARADAFQEALDGIAYSEARRQQVRDEGRGFAEFGWWFVRILFTLTADIARRLP